MLVKTGIPTADDLQVKYPSLERLKKGPVAIVECFTAIPCDPCYHSCPVQAFKEFKDINDIPELNFEKCSGCGFCIARCPGLAIFVVDYNYSAEYSLVRLPYELSPLPVEGQEVITLNRAGQELGKGRIERVQNSSKLDKTAIVWLAVPRENLMDVRHFKAGDRDE